MPTRPSWRFSLCMLISMVVGACAVNRDDSADVAGVARWPLQPIEVPADGLTEAAYAFEAKGPTSETWRQAWVEVIASDTHVLVQQPAPTGPDGMARGRLRCTQAGTYALAAHVVLDGGVRAPLQGSQRVHCVSVAVDKPADNNTILPPPSAAEVLIITAEHELGATDVSNPTLVTLLVTNAQGMPLADQVVTLMTTRASDKVVPSTATTDAQGRVKVSLTATHLGAAVVVAQVGSVKASTSVQFVAGAPDVAQSTLVPRPGRVVADGIQTLVFDVVVRDSAGNGVPYAAVTFAGGLAGDVMAPPSGLTDQAGAAQVALSGTQAGLRTVTVSTHNGSINSQGTLYPGPVSAATSMLVLNPNSTTADGVSPSYVTVTLADAQGNPVPNSNVTVTSSVASDQLGAALVQSGADGRAQTQVMGTQMGTRTITAQSGAANLTAALSLTAGPPNTALSQLHTAHTTRTAGEATTVTLQLLDGHGNPTAGYTVLFSGSGARDAIVPASGTTDAAGMLTAQFVGLDAGSHTIVASIGGAGTSLTTTVAVTPATPDASRSTLTAASTLATANGTSPIAFTVGIQDRYGNAVPAAPVAMRASGSANVFAPASGNTDSSGQFISNLTSTRAQTETVTAAVGGQDIAATAVQFVSGPNNAAASSFAVTPSSAVADGQAAIAVKVTFKDAQGNARSNQAVVLNITGTATGSLTPASGTTDAQGEFTSVLQSTQAGGKNLTARAGDVELTAAATFVPGAPALATSTLSTSPSAIVADGQSQSSITGVLRDAYGNTVGNSPITWSFDGPGATVTPAGAASDAAGAMAATLTGTVAGAGNVIVVAGPLTLSRALTLVAGPPASARSFIALSPNTQVANGAPIAVTVRVRDAQNNPVPAASVTFGIDKGSITATPGDSVTDASGNTRTVWSSTVTGIGRMTAQVGSMVLNRSATFVAGPQVAANSSFSVSAGSPTADGFSPSTLTVLLRDAYNNAVPGAVVALSSSTGSDVLTPSSLTTDSSGRAVSALTATIAGSRTVRAQSGGVTLDAAAAFVPGPPAANTSTLTISPNAVVANGTDAAVVRWLLRDSTGNPTPSVPVMFVSGAAGLTLTGGNTTTDAAGVAQATVTGTQAGAAVVHAQAGATEGNVTLQLLPGPPNTTRSSWLAGAAATADGASVVTLSLALKDAQNNPTPNVPVTLMHSGAGMLGATSGVTDATGLFATTLASFVAGPEDVSISWGQGLLVTTASFLPGPAAANTSSFSVSPSVLPADGSSQATLSVIAQDAYGNAVPGLTAAFSSSDANDVLSANAITDDDGEASGTFISAYQGVKTITALLQSGLALAANITVTASGATNQSVVLTASPNMLVADGVSTSTITIVGTDAYGNTLSGHTAALQVNNAGAALGQNTLVLDANGRAATTLTSTNVATLTVQATIDGVTISTTAKAIAGSPNAALSSLQISPSQVTADGVSQALVTVNLRDALNHPIASSQVMLAGDGQVAVLATNLTTGGTGQASTRVTSTVAGNHTITASAGAITLTKVATFVAGPADASSSVLTLSPNQVTADGNQSINVVLALKDAHGNPIINDSATLSSSNTGITGLPITAATDAAGRIATSLKSTRAGPFTLSAAATNYSVSVQGAFVPGAPSSTLSTLVANPNSVTADGTAAVLGTVLLRDSFNNPVNLVPITFSCLAPGIALSPVSASTDAAGRATTSLNSTVTGPAQLRAQGGGVSLVTDVQFTAGSPNTSTSSLTVAPDTLIANGNDAAAITVVARDSFGNYVPYQQVTLSAASPSITLTGPTATDANGVWRGTAASTLAQAQTLTATLGGAALAKPITFVAGPPSAAMSSVTAGATSTVANGQSSVNLVVQLADATGNPVANQSVALAIGGSNNAPGSLSGSTDAAGQWRTTLSSTRAENKTLTVTAGALTLNGNVLFVSGPPSSSTSTVAASPNTQVANNLATTTVTVLVRDSFGNVGSGRTVSMVTLPAGYSLAASSGTTDASGMWSTTLKSTVAGTPSLTAVFDGASATSTVTFVAGPPSAATSTLGTSAPTFAADGQSQLSIYLQLADAYNNPVPAALASFTSTIASDVLNPNSGTTQASGGLSTAMVAQQTGPRTITAAIGGLQLTTQVTAGPGLPSSDTSTLTFSPNTVTADGVSVAGIDVRAFDRLGHAVPGQSVSLAATGSANTFAPRTGPTDANGLFHSTLASTMAESKNITATLGSTSISGAVTFVAGPLNPNTSAFSASPTTLVADGQATAALQLTALDAYSNPIVGRSVAFTTSGSNNTLSPANSSTLAGGRASASIASTRAEVKNIVARVNSVGISTQVTFTAGAANVGTSVVTASPNTIVANGSQTTLRLQLLDAQGNPVAGQTTNVSVSGSNNTLGSSSGSTNASGVFTTTLSSTTAELKTVTVSAGGITVETQVQCVPGAPTTAFSTLTASPNTVAADGNSLVQLRLTLKDAYGNVTPNISAAFTVTGSNNTLQSTPATSDATGSAQLTLKSTRAENKSITASFAGTSLSTTVQFVAGPVDNAASSLTANPNSIAADSVSQSTVVVLLADAQGNPVIGAPVTFNASGSGSVFNPQVTSTDGAGRASTLLTGTQAGNKLITASTTNTTVSGAITLLPGPPSNARSSFAISPNIITANNAASATLSVIVRDAFDNLLSGSPVTFSASGSGYTLLPNAGTTDINGAFVGQVMGTVAETKTISAALPGTSLSQQMVLVPGPVNPNQSSLTALPTQIVADGAQAITLSLVLRDYYNNLISNAPTTLSSSSARTVFDVTQGVTDANGRFLAHIVSTKAQPVVITASAGGTAINSSVTFLPGNFTAQSISLVAQPGYQSADANSAIAVTLTVADTLGNPIQGQTATITSSTPADTIVMPVPPYTGADGKLTASLFATQAGTRTLTANPNGIVTSTTATIAPGVPNAATSSMVISPNTVVADGSSLGSLVVTVRDAFANVVPNQAVTVSLTSGDAARTTLNPNSGFADSSGVFVVQVTSPLAENKVFGAAFASVLLNASARFVPGPISSATSSVTASPNFVTIDGTTPTLITVRLKDAQGNLEPNQAVSLSVSGGNNTLSPASGTTDANGTLTATLVSTRAEYKTIIATTSTTSINGNVTFGPGQPNSTRSTLAAAPTPLVADNTALTTLTAVARDAFGNAVPNVAVTLTGGTSVTYLPSSGTTDSAGTWQPQAKSALAQTANITATLGAAQASTQVVWTSGPPAAGHVFLVLSPNVLTIDGASSALAQATFLDAYDNPVIGQTVTLTVPSPYTVVQPAAPTDSAGKATGQASGTLAGNTNVTASLGGISISAQLTLLPGPPSAAKSNLTLSPNTQVADNVATVAVSATFRDAYSNVLSTGAITWAGAGGNDTFTPTTSSLSSGSAAATLKSSLAHTVVVGAQLGAASLMGNVVFVPGPPSAATSSLVLSPNTQVADGSAQMALTALINDALGNPVPAQPVTFAITGGAASIAAASGNTSSTGLYATTATATLAGPRTVTATAGSLTLTQSATFTAGPPVLANSTFTGTSVAIADGNATLLTTAKLYDAYLNVVPNIALTVSTAGTNITITPPSGTTDAGGNFSSTLSSTVVQNTTYTLACQGQNFTYNANFTVGPPAKATSSFVASPNSALASNGTASSTMTLTLRDSQSRLLPGYSIIYSKPGAEGVLSVQGGQSNASGQSSVGLTSTQSGLRTVFASTGDFFISAQASFATRTKPCSTYPLLGGRTAFYTNGAATAAVQIVATDLNGDGTVDFIQLHANPNRFGVFAQYTGFSAAAQSFPITGSASNMVVTNLNSDSAKDIVVATNANYIQTFLGSGASYNSNTILGLTGTITAVCAADINHDGYMDIVAVSSTASPGFYVLPGNGSGGYGTPTFYNLTGTPSKCVLADFNGDGYMDIAVSNTSASYPNIDILLGNSGRTFNGKTAYGVGQNGSFLVSGLINNDSLPDLISGRSSSNTIYILLAKANGTLDVSSLPSDTDTIAGLALVDINGDGKTDILATGSNPNLRTYLGRGDGTFLSPTFHSLGVSPSAFGVADFDKDGNLDIAYMAANFINASYIDYGTGGGNFSVRHNQYAGYDPTNSIAADINGDGRADVIHAAKSGTPPRIHLNNGDGTFASPMQIGTLLPGRVTSGDFDGDGFIDFAGLNAGTPNMIMYLGAGNGNFTVSQKTFSPANTTASDFVSAADLNLDGMSDFIHSAASTFQIVFGGRTPAAITAGPTFAMPSGNNCGPAIAVDLDNDGIPDLVALCSYLTVYKGLGRGVFAAPTVYTAYPSNYGLTPVTRDFDDDGFQDIAYLSSNTVRVILNDGTGQLKTTARTSFSTSGTIIAAGDFDGDGRSDIAWSGNQSTHYVATNDGTGTMTVIARPTALPSNSIMASDLNGDGKVDLFSVGYGGFVTSFMNVGCAP